MKFVPHAFHVNAQIGTCRPLHFTTADDPFIAFTFAMAMEHTKNPSDHLLTVKWKQNGAVFS